ncbi:hypothetical protein N7448_010768 [Penicillium atrosanguineum]|nr:hypothetical protein N7448_010768 [Penicillium atrosanguineum]
MAARIPIRQVPAMFARRQPKVFNISKPNARVIGAIARTSQVSRWKQTDADYFLFEGLQSSSAPQTQNPAYPLYPSVAQLLHQKNVPESEVSKIPASGPKGRLLKGDVLAYLGEIAAEYPASQAANLAKLTYLDLSNIKIAAALAPKPAPVAETVVAKPPAMASVAISISLAEVLRAQSKIERKTGVSVPLSRFLAVATDLANDDLPRSKANPRSVDELFDELLGAEPINTTRGDYIPELNAFEAKAAPEPVKEDLIDFLSAKPSKKTVSASLPPSDGVASNVFSLTVPKADEPRAKEFLERMKTLLQYEPASLVL